MTTLYLKIAYFLMKCAFVQLGTVFEEEFSEVSQQDVIKRWTGLSSTSCLLRCRRDRNCELAAVTPSECLFLRNISKLDDDNQTNKKLEVTLLKEIDFTGNSRSR